MPKVIVVVSGGVVQSAYSNDDIHVEILDLDDVEAEGNDVDAALSEVESHFDPIY